MLSESRSERTLRSLPREKAFYFFTSIGNYTGKKASSLEEFAKKVLEVNAKSLEFHLYRNDFEMWISETLEDRSLASKIRQLKALKPIGIDLRDRLYLIVSKYYESLKKPVSATTTTIQGKPRTTLTFESHSSSGAVKT